MNEMGNWADWAELIDATRGADELRVSASMRAWMVESCTHRVEEVTGAQPDQFASVPVVVDDRLTGGPIASGDVAPAGTPGRYVGYVRNVGWVEIDLDALADMFFPEARDER